MRHIKAFRFILIFIVSITLWGEENFKLIEKWDPGDEVVGRVGESIVDADGHVVCTFYKSGSRLITPNKIIKFAPYGQGPGDLTDMRALFHFGGDIAIVERPEKIKIFTKKDSTYVWKKTVWLKRGKFVHVVQDAIYYKNKWFLAGLEFVDFDNKKNLQYASFLKIYEKNGQPIENLIKKTFDGPHRFHEMNYYVAAYKDQVLFLVENEMKVHVVGLKDLSIKKEVNLETPGFYKKKPDEFYSPKGKTGAGKNYLSVLEHWKTSYSRINKVIVEDSFLLLQVRTCSEKLKRFALLFYNAGNFKLEKTIYTDDLLLGVKEGKYYFFAGGDPGRDEEAEDFIINVYSFGEKSEKK